MTLLEVQQISKKHADKNILENISFQQKPLQKIAITGESGSGKSTLLKIISGHVQSDSGTVYFNDEKVFGPEEKLMTGHQDIAYLSQHYELNNNYVVRDLIWFQVKMDASEAKNLFNICRISHLLDRKTNHLSGGEKQRIALCKLLLKLPKLLVMDEPFSNLDPINKNTLKVVLEDITERLQITCLLASHDPNDTLSWAEEIIVMKEGRIIQTGTPQQIYYYPIDQYVAGMFGKYNLLTQEQAAWFGIEANGKDVLIRPENFIINEKDGEKGTIQKITFLGSYYEIEILVNDLRIVSHLMINDREAGKEVFVKAVGKGQGISFLDL